MKRLLSSLLLMFAITMFLPGMAHAVVKCVPVQAGSSWPAGNYTQYCDGTTLAQGQIIYNALNGTNAQNTMTTVQGKSYSFKSWTVAQQAISKYTGVFYLFNTPTDFYNYAVAYFKPAGIPYPTVAGIGTFEAFTQYPTSGTWQGRGPGLYTVVFATPSDGTQKVNPIISTDVNHEIGHYFDWLFGATAGFVNGVVSNSSDYKAELSIDWDQINAAPPCYTSSNSGLFYGLADNAGLKPPYTPHYFCDGNQGTGTKLQSPYDSMANNQTILSATSAWAYIYGIGNAPYAYKELLAETYGGGDGLAGAADFANHPDEVDYYLGYTGAANSGTYVRGFDCTISFLQYLLFNNAVPSKANPPNSWPTICPLF